MAWSLYKVNNGPMAASVAPTAASVGATTKTMLQLLHPNNALNVVEWGVSFNGTSANVPATCELLSTNTVAATVTAYVANDVVLYTDPGANTPGLTLSTSGSGYNATAEGSIVTARTGDLQLVAPTNQYLKQFPLGQEFVVPATNVLRVRITAPTTINCFCYVIFGLS